MKTFIKNTLKFAFIATAMFAGTVFASAAGTFDSNPAGTSTGFVSISGSPAIDSCRGCANQNSSINVSIPNPGDTDQFSVFIDFRNQASESSANTISNARGRFSISGSTITGRLTGTNATNSGLTDSVSVNNLPRDYEINFVSARVENTHANPESPGSEFCQGYNENFRVTESTLFGSGALIGDLDTFKGGWCDQGYVVATLEARNTTQQQQQNANVLTRSAIDIDENSGRIQGRLTEGNDVDLYFRYGTSSNISCTNGGTRVNVRNNVSAQNDFDTNLTNLNDDTQYYYIACAEDNGSLLDSGFVESFETTTESNNGGNLSVSTQVPTAIGQTSARLNGEVTGGETNFAYFVWGTDRNPSCNSNQIQTAENWTDTRTNGDDFQFTLGSIRQNTTYYYRACASANNQTAAGDIRNFTTTGESNPVGGGGLFVETRRQANEDRDSAELRGRVETGSFEDVDVFFAWGEDQGDVGNVEDENRFSDIFENGRDLQIERVRNDFDGEQNFSLNVAGLRSDTRIYYRQCVEFRNDNGNDDIECGELMNFFTDNDGQGGNTGNVSILTQSARNINVTSAQMCGEITNDGGSAVPSYIEFRRASDSNFSRTPVRQRNEVVFCEDVSGLTANTQYRFRACTPQGCGTERSFTTLGVNVPNGEQPFIFTETPTNIRSNSATLNSRYVANAPSATCRFDYGRTQDLGRQTRTYNVNGIGQCPHNFTNLASNTQYCVQAVITTQFGTDRGNITCFNTPASTTVVRPGTSATPPVRVPAPIVVVEDDNEELDLGLGLSLVRLDIDDNEEVVTRGERIEYQVEWENISELNLTDLDIKIDIPSEFEITDISRGRFDNDSNTVFFTIDELEGADFEENLPGQSGRMTITGIIGRGNVGNLLTAEAEIAYDNPVNRAQENARDFDISEYGTQVAGVTASVFGLTNITFLGWLVILLGLFIIFLVARWLYLEREELRAQAYLTGGYGNQGYAQPRMPAYQNQQPPQYNVPPAAPQVPTSQGDYEPYRPNRG